MTINTTSSGVTYIGNNSTAVFTFNFVGVDASDIVVLFTDNGTTTQLSPSQYTLFLNPPATGALWGIGGTVTYPKVGSPITNQQSLTIKRMLPFTQLTSISNQGDFYPTVVEETLDTLCMQIQQVNSRTGQDRGVWTTNTTYNYGDIVQDGINGTNTGNYYTCIVPNTAQVWTSDLAAGYWSLSFNLQVVQGYATSAASSATSAGNSAITATAEANIASAAAITATVSATTATTEAGIATTAATTATTEAGIATTAANTASSAATTATTAATTATTEAGIATTAATSASQSATIASSTLTGTSTTSNTIGTGSYTFFTQVNKQFQGGQFVIVSSGINYIIGQVTAYNTSTGQLDLTEVANAGSGTYSSWNISVTGVPGSGGSGSGTVTSVSVLTANGISGSVSNPTTTPALTLSLGAIAPSSVASSGNVSGTTLTSTVSTGTAPLIVSSTTPVANLSIGGNAATVTTNANSTGDVTSVGNTTTVTKIQGTSVVGTTGTGNVVFSSSPAISSPTLTTPTLGTPASGTLTNCTGLPAGGITLTDTTTNNVSISAHGFAPKAPNDATKYLDGTGAYTIPAGGTAFYSSSSASTSGTTVNFINLPSGKKQFTLTLDQVSTNGTSQMIVQLGDSSDGYVITGYKGQQGNFSSVPSAISAGFGCNISSVAAGNYSGSLLFTNITGNKWACQSIVGRTDVSGTTALTMCGGSIDLGDVLDRIRVTTINGTDTFDAGTVGLIGI